MDRRLQIVTLGVAALVLAGGGFAAGAAFGPRSAATAAVAPDQTAAIAEASGAPGAAQGRRALGASGQQGAAAGGQLVGRVLSVGDGSLTIETRDAAGGTTRSVIALVGSTTRVVKTAETEIKLADIKPGDQVVVAGQPDATTGTVSATAVVVGGTAFQQVVRPGASPSAKP